MALTLIPQEVILFFKPTVYKSSSSLRKIFSCCIVFFLLFTPLHAQIWINGSLKDKLSQKPIINGEVRSSLSNTLSDSNGFFRLRVIKDDIISVKKFGYRFDTIHFSLRMLESPLVILMEPLGSVMRNVTVKSSYQAYQLDSLKRRMLFEEGNSKISFVSKQPHQGFGLVFNLDRFTKSKDKRLKKQRQLFERSEQWAYIRYRFPDSLVQSYTGLSGNRLQIFMRQYTPSYQWLREHTSKMEVIVYINDKVKLFRKK